MTSTPTQKPITRRETKEEIYSKTIGEFESYLSENIEFASPIVNYITHHNSNKWAIPPSHIPYSEKLRQRNEFYLRNYNIYDDVTLTKIANLQRQLRHVKHEIQMCSDDFRAIPGCTRIWETYAGIDNIDRILDLTIVNIQSSDGGDSSGDSDTKSNFFRESLPTSAQNLIL
jgi:hypothetical protein